MAKKSRLRTQKSKGRRLVLAMFFVFLAISGYWLLANKIQIADYVHTIFRTGRDASEADAITRGVIYDRNLKELAVSMDRVSVYATVRELESLNEAAMRLAPALNRSEDSLLEKLKGSSLQVWLAENITQEEEDAVLRLNMKGILLHKEKVRYYPMKEKASHFLGYAENQMGLSGVEYTYNLWLNQYGAASHRNRKTAGQAGDAANDPASHNLILTVDLKIQDILEKYITDIGSAREGMRLGAMIMEAKTGNIIGCVNYPSYDPNHFREYKKVVLDNIFVEPVAIPGTVRSFLVDVASLQADEKKEGDVLPWSISANAASFGSEIRFWDKLGFNDNTRVDFIAENDKPQKIQMLTQDLGSARNNNTVPAVATPLQILTAVTRILNGGLKISPHMVDAEKNPRVSPIIRNTGERIVREAVSGEAQNLFAAMTQGGPLSSGTQVGEGLAFTANAAGNDYRRNQILITVIPAKGSELVIMIVADYGGLDPAGAGRAGVADLVSPGMKMIYPIVTLQQVLSNLSDMMTAEEKEKMNYQAPQSAKSNTPKTVEQQDVMAPATMPDLTGLSLRKSLRLVKGLPLDVHVQGSGRVIAQSPAAGAVLADIKECTITLQPKVNKNKPGKEFVKAGKKPETGSANESKGSENKGNETKKR
ncbi:MAG: penicillin-binding transpeptidase domain-containing protein [Desulfocapsaceae bacterium]|nr:penicillin-binding transpeptidase domain-containing protein [Desulfocapsaceae bacterium]